jgi:hypothetical protein
MFGLAGGLSLSSYRREWLAREMRRSFSGRSRSRQAGYCALACHDQARNPLKDATITRELAELFAAARHTPTGG